MEAHFAPTMRARDGSRAGACLVVVSYHRILTGAAGGVN